MKAIRLSFIHMLLFVRRDMMLLAACLTPFLAGIFFRFAVPFLEKILINWSGTREVLGPYYELIDLFYCVLTPVMFCFIAAMIILEEHDDHIESYLCITTLGRNGYLISRIVVPAAAAYIITTILLPVFSLTNLSITEFILLPATGTLQAIITALLIVTLSTNKLEGMAVTKISTITILGALIPYFIPGKIQYALSFLPSFWSGKAMQSQKPAYLPISILLALIWIYPLLKKFSKKIS